MSDFVRVWRVSTGERLPDLMPSDLVALNKDLTTVPPEYELVKLCCGGGFEKRKTKA